MFHKNLCLACIKISKLAPFGMLWNYCSYELQTLLFLSSANKEILALNNPRATILQCVKCLLWQNIPVPCILWKCLVSVNFSFDLMKLRTTCKQAQSWLLFTGQEKFCFKVYNLPYSFNFVQINNLYQWHCSFTQTQVAVYRVFNSLNNWPVWAMNPTLRYFTLKKKNWKCFAAPTISR